MHKYTNDSIPELIRERIEQGITSLLEDPQLVLYARVNSRDKLVLVYGHHVKTVVRAIALKDEVIEKRGMVAWLEMNLQHMEQHALNWLVDAMCELRKDEC